MLVERFAQGKSPSERSIRCSVGGFQLDQLLSHKGLSHSKDLRAHDAVSVRSLADDALLPSVRSAFIGGVTK